MNSLLSEEVEKNNKIFNSLLYLLKKEENEYQKIVLAKCISEFAIKRNVKIYSCYAIENELLNISNKYHIPQTKVKYKKSFLHVMTTSYNVGGHTRVVERWIENSPNDEIHSVIILQQGAFDIPQKLKDVVKEKQGHFVEFDNCNQYIENALKLRQFAQDYETIILHVHLHDPVPILAFGTEEFERPIVFFNHAEHLFNLGVSIADVFVDFRSFASNISVTRRKVSKPFVLHLPVESQSQTNVNNHNCNNQKTILSIGRGNKYYPFGDYDFIKTAQAIIKNNKNVIMYVIGVNPEERAWKKAIKESNNRIIPKSLIAYDKLNEYIISADLYIESFPFSSFLAMLDVAKNNIPSLSLQTPISHLDSIVDSPSFCYSQEELIKKATDILSDTETDKYRLGNNIKRFHGKENWCYNLKDLIKEIPPLHKVHHFENNNDQTTDYEIFLNQMLKQNTPNQNLIYFEDNSYLSLENKKKIEKILKKYRVIEKKKIIDTLFYYKKDASRIKIVLLGVKFNLKIMPRKY